MIRCPKTASAVAALTLLAAAWPGPAAASEPSHAVTIYGDPPLYGADFEHWNYVDPAAPKGGRLVIGAFGSFDSLNNFIQRGEAADGLGLLYDSLLVGSADEAATYYTHLAETVELSDDRTAITFTLRDGATFHDGTPVTVDDVVWSHETFRDQGRPFYRTRFYDKVSAIEALDDRTVRFTLTDTTNRQLPLALGTFPILPRHYWADRVFNEGTLEPPLGSGPYRIAEVDAGRSITYERVEDYWAAELPTRVGTYNFDRITYQYYRDETVRYEAFKAGEFDYLTVNDPQEWVTGFEGVGAVDDGTLIMELLDSTDPAGASGFAFNLRRPMFADPRVREALIHLYDFETAQRQIHHGFFKRAESFFPNTELAATGLPEGEELAVLESVRGDMPDHVAERIFVEEPSLPTTDGSGRIRGNLRIATDLFEEAGWSVDDAGALRNVETGEPMAFEMVYGSPTIEPTMNALVQNFELAGIRAVPRFVDGANWQNRIFEYNYDLFFSFSRPFYPPGAELREGYGSAVANVPGNYNLSGVQDPALDRLVEEVIAAQSWDAMVVRTRALDRYLRFSFLELPFFYDDTIRIAYWDILDRPETRPRFGLAILSTWWFDPSNEAALRENR